MKRRPLLTIMFIVMSENMRPGRDKNRFYFRTCTFVTENWFSIKLGPIKLYNHEYLSMSNTMRHICTPYHVDLSELVAGLFSGSYHLIILNNCTKIDVREKSLWKVRKETKNYTKDSIEFIMLCPVFHGTNSFYFVWFHRAPYYPEWWVLTKSMEEGDMNIK